MPINSRAIFDTASFILGGEICNSTKNTQTVTDISTPCLSACVDNNYFAVLFIIITENSIAVVFSHEILVFVLQYFC